MFRERFFPLKRGNSKTYWYADGSDQEEEELITCVIKDIVVSVWWE